MTDSPQSPEGEAIFLYDASCVLCSGSANFVAKRDEAGRFRYADVSSTAARDLMAAHGLTPHSFDAAVLIDRGQAYTGAAAALRILRALPYPWR